ncbi:cell division protein FtsL [Solemya pervernicosa gill symbiont]|uniref:Cell division protein FtsL n=2 Tax=Gammaproteobacteria incertae sedis TaxID=118884 RepID=A0A1T2LA10_9GAMM|nr:cell division protein FtsL [Candidatus Reidiella endopervernicosa]OOZ41852.1 cell division protein FtsL [Solemya pervernicosa gill symbiont]QKQ26193.1 cell division protein FtsL [Candidatus Reidiella endopervernicosa]
MSGQLMAMAFLLPALFVSAIGVVYAKHETRKLFIELRSLQSERDVMDTEWGQLQLEQSTWSTHGRIERAAREKLGMKIPDTSEVVIVTP